MQTIEAILFEPVGCLAEFPAEPFLEIAVRYLGKPEQKKQATQSGSRAYWHMLNLIETAGGGWSESQKCAVDRLEAESINAATMYEDVLPALVELKTMGIQLLIATSLSEYAAGRFVDKYGLGGVITRVWNRDNSQGIKAAPLAAAIESIGAAPQRTMFLTDTAEGLNVAGEVGAISILLMNDPDEAMRLALRNPSGGIVSLHELPDFVRVVAAENTARLRG